MQATGFLLAPLLLALPQAAGAQDCNGNGVLDSQDIASGTSLDCNGNGIPDECDVDQLALFHDFDGGGLPPGITMTTTGLWHITKECRPAGTCSSERFMYFGIEDTGIPSFPHCNYQTNSAVMGQFAYHDVPIPSDPSAAVLTFCHAWQAESDCGHDFLTVEIDNQIVDEPCFDGWELDWTTRTVDLSAWAGQTVKIKFRFETDDALFNHFYGWAIDNVQVGRPGTPGILNCNGNLVPDSCEIAAGTIPDFNGNGLHDGCEPRLGAPFCSANPNSTGAAASIFALGSTTIADNELWLVTTNLPHHQFGYYLMSMGQNFVPLFAGSQGNLCLGAPILRFSHQPGGVLNTGSLGAVGYPVDMTSLPQGVQFMTLDTWNFQLWFRDVNPSSTSNTSDGVSVTFF